MTANQLVAMSLLARRAAASDGSPFPEHGALMTTIDGVNVDLPALRSDRATVYHPDRDTRDDDVVDPDDSDDPDDRTPR